MDAFEKAINDQIYQDEVKFAIETLKKELSKDKSKRSYYHTWQANISMAFKNEFNRYADDNEISATARNFNIHQIANNAAKNFLDSLIS